MTPQEEQLSLRENPLPQKLPEAMVYTTCPSEQVLMTIAYLQEEIESEQEHIAYLQKAMDTLKSRAIKENLTQSGKYYLVEIPGKKMRNPIKDYASFKSVFPDAYKFIRIAQRIELENQMTSLDNLPIPLGLADKYAGSELVTEFTGYQPQKITVEVRTMQELLK